ncbi:hypothetical protein B0O80DRAFT_287701 [Mortierella sp. GBAus27b]|nr:hypothetical protein B0O80DRAFT_287701 [Mortierella sp. GBAus27b]
MVVMWCLVSGMSLERAFSVKVSEDDTVYDLKEAIKAKILEFKDIGALQLTLWKVSIPDIGNDETPILLDHVSGDKRKLRPTEAIADVFAETPPKNTIHIIVQRPLPDPSVQDNAEMARLRKQVSDMEALTSTSNSRS